MARRFRLLAAVQVAGVGLAMVMFGDTSGAAAAASPEYLTVTTPVSGTEVGSRSFEIAGEGVPEATVSAVDATGSFIASTIVDATGAWRMVADYAPDAANEQVLRINEREIVDGVGVFVDHAFVAVRLPAGITPDPTGRLAITYPSQGVASPTRYVIFGIDAPEGAELKWEADFGPYPTLNGTTVIAGRETSGLIFVPFDNTVNEVTVNLWGVDRNGFSFAGTSRTIAVPAALPPPVVVSPRNDQTVSATGGTSTVIRGTGVPNAPVHVFVVSRDEETSLGFYAANPEYDGTYTEIDSSGNWTASVVATPGDFAVEATHVLGGTSNDATTPMSARSERVLFSAVADPTTPPMVQPTPQVGGSIEPQGAATAVSPERAGLLAATGPAHGALPLAGLLLVAVGVGLLASGAEARRRRTR